MIVAPLSINIAGEWSVRQAEAVIRALTPECEGLGIDLEMLDISTHGRPHRVLLQVVCARHGTPIEVDAACQTCLAVSR